jgi:hypothetical protein
MEIVRLFGGHRTCLWKTAVSDPPKAGYNVQLSVVSCL